MLSNVIQSMKDKKKIGYESYLTFFRLFKYHNTFSILRIAQDSSNAVPSQINIC